MVSSYPNGLTTILVRRDFGLNIALHEIDQLEFRRIFAFIMALREIDQSEFRRIRSA